MRAKGRLTCAKCSAYFPLIEVLRCDNTILGVTLTMCRTCHKRFHPACTDHVVAARAEDRLCDKCLINEAVVVCPQCVDKPNTKALRTEVRTHT